MFGTVASFAGPHSNVSISIVKEMRMRPQMCSQNGRIASSPARPMSHEIITTLRFQRSTSAPPIGASKNPGSMRAIITSAIAFAPSRRVCDREDRQQADPISETRDELRAEERKEPRDAKTFNGAGGIGSSSGLDGMNGACSLTRNAA